MPLNDRQKRFCDFYIANGGNATKAAKDAGYSDKTAYASGAENLKKPQIQEYIKSRTEQTDKSTIASGDEVLETLTSILRREYTDSVVITVKTESSHYDKNGKIVKKKQEVPQLVEIPAKLSDVNRSAELLGKYAQLWDGAGKANGSNAQAYTKLMDALKGALDDN